MRALRRHLPRLRRAPGHPLHLLLLFGMLVPLLGATAVGGTAVHDRYEVRTASLALRARAADLTLQTQFVSALAAEETHSNVLALAAGYDEDTNASGGIDLDVTRARIAGARAVVDSDRFAGIRRTLGLDDRLRRLRQRVDVGSADYRAVSTFFGAADIAIEGAWETAMDELNRYADQEALPARLRNRLRSLRGAMTALAVTDDRVDHALALFIATPTATRTRLLIDASARFDAGLEAAEETASPRLAATLARLDTSPAAQRTEENMDLATRIGLGVDPPLSDIDTATLAGGLADGARWAILLTDVVRAAAVELEEAASVHADWAQRTMVTQLLGMGALIAASLAVGTVMARAITTPVRRLEGAVRQVEAGEFQLDPLPDHGPRELAAMARAFNDMSGTLAAVEDHAVALATDPGSPVLDEALPGRTGEAMQAALDRLRASIAEAEARRAELVELATHDSLTGLLNRGAAMQALARDLARAERDGSSLLALFLDLDGLKQLNDTHGHDAGDAAIRAAADALRASTRDGDVVARLGGDEFLVVGPLPPGGLADAERFAHRIHDSVRSQTVRTATGSAVPLRCSVGAAVSGSDTGSIDDLVRAADLALYDAKDAGRDQVAWAPDLARRISGLR
ncbi:MAG TPA: diguanylate cyclase [Acidimicrobiales bacterium]|nr:diguanylate cyclase [Acidimicrobiales bacterium]